MEVILKQDVQNLGFKDDNNKVEGKYSITIEWELSIENINE